MIFSSHNYKYKPVVEQVAIKQCAIYGLQNTFYDRDSHLIPSI